MWVIHTSTSLCALCVHTYVHTCVRVYSPILASWCTYSTKHVTTSLSTALLYNAWEKVLSNTPSSPPLPSPPINSPPSPPFPPLPSPHRQVQRLCGQHLWLGGRSRVQDPRVRLSGLRRQPGPCDWQRAPPVRPEAEPPRGGHCAAPAQVRRGEWDVCHMTERLLWWCVEECYGFATNT